MLKQFHYDTMNFNDFHIFVHIHFFQFFWIWPDQSDTPDTDLVIGHKNVIA